ncbi:MAG: FGGY-family carbohydrate kinase [Bacilli bacterium]|nr:FGGY-family carbohydrate kinase [Bacilli bacterium]
MENSALVLTIDFGTQSVRVSLFDKFGEVLCQDKERYDPPYFSTKPGYAEQNPDEYFNAFTKASKRMLDAHKDLLGRIRGVCMSCFRDTAVYLDKDMKIVRPTILWLDQRYAKCEKPLPLMSRAIFKLVGMKEVINMNRRRTAMNWIKENEPENFAKIEKYVAISTYFIYRLTGQLKDSPSDYTGHYPIDFKKCEFYKKPETHLQGQIFSIKRSQLPELVPGLSVLGSITPETSLASSIPAGLPLFASGSDKACETLGSGVIDEDKAAVSLGTACTIETTMQRYVGPTPLLPAYPFVLPGYYNMDFQIYRGFWTINWFLKEFGAQTINDLMADDAGDPTAFNAKLNTVPAGCDGLLLQPYWGSQLDRPLVKGSVVGFSDSTTLLHLYRALIEGIGYELREQKEKFEKNLKHGFSEIRIAGGGARSDEICQILANVIGLPVVRLQTVETSSLGAAMAGFLGLGIYGSAKDAVKNMVRPQDRFEVNQEEKKVYDELFYGSYVKLYPSLKGIYKHQFDFTHK